MDHEGQPPSIKTITILAVGALTTNYALPIYKTYFGDGDLAGIVFTCSVTLLGSAAVYYCEDFSSQIHS